MASRVIIDPLSGIPTLQPAATPTGRGPIVRQTSIRVPGGLQRLAPLSGQLADLIGVVRRRQGREAVVEAQEFVQARPGESEEQRERRVQEQFRLYLEENPDAPVTTSPVFLQALGQLEGERGAVDLAARLQDPRVQQEMLDVTESGYSKAPSKTPEQAWAEQLEQFQNTEAYQNPFFRRGFDARLPKLRQDFLAEMTRKQGEVLQRQSEELYGEKFGPLVQQLSNAELPEEEVQRILTMFDPVITEGRDGLAIANANRKGMSAVLNHIKTIEAESGVDAALRAIQRMRTSTQGGFKLGDSNNVVGAEFAREEARLLERQEDEEDQENRRVINGRQAATVQGELIGAELINEKVTLRDFEDEILTDEYQQELGEFAPTIVNTIRKMLRAEDNADDRDDPEAYRRLLTLMAQGEWDEARRVFSEGLEDDNQWWSTDTLQSMPAKLRRSSDITRDFGALPESTNFRNLLNRTTRRNRAGTVGRDLEAEDVAENERLKAMMFSLQEKYAESGDFNAYRTDLSRLAADIEKVRVDRAKEELRQKAEIDGPMYEANEKGILLTGPDGLLSQETTKALFSVEEHASRVAANNSAVQAVEQWKNNMGPMVEKQLTIRLQQKIQEAIQQRQLKEPGKNFAPDPAVITGLINDIVGDTTATVRDEIDRLQGDDKVAGGVFESQGDRFAEDEIARVVKEFDANALLTETAETNRVLELKNPDAPLTLDNLSDIPLSPSNVDAGQAILEAVRQGHWSSRKSANTLNGVLRHINSLPEDEQAQASLELLSRGGILRARDYEKGRVQATLPGRGQGETRAITRQRIDLSLEGVEFPEKTLLDFTGFREDLDSTNRTNNFLDAYRRYPNAVRALYETKVNPGGTQEEYDAWLDFQSRAHRGK